MTLKNCLIIVSSDSAIHLEPGEDADSNVILQAGRLPPRALNILRIMSGLPLPVERSRQKEKK
jgi:hypothetical protein